VFGYYIEISKPNLSLVPADYDRKQTLVNAERFTSSELVGYERKVLSAEERALRSSAACTVKSASPSRTRPTACGRPLRQSRSSTCS